MTELNYNDESGIRELLIGHSVQKVNDDELLLDNGTKLKIVPNDGCGGCYAGNYELKSLCSAPNAIMNVEFQCEDRSEEYEGETTYRIFVYAANEKLTLLEVEGSDGNGYYGTGYWITVEQ